LEDTVLDIATPELRYFSYKGGKLAYREMGSGFALFLLHGMNGSSKSWTQLFQELGSSFRVVAWDAPSFGRSDIFGDDIFDYKNAAKALLHDLKIEDAIIIGHSMGGIIAAQLAADVDISVSGLVLSSSHLGFAYPKGEELIPRYANRLKFFSNNSAPKSYTLDRAKVSTPKGTSEGVINFLANVAEDLREESILDGGRMSQETDNREICSKIKVPVLVLSGAQDTIISTEMHNAVIEAFPDALQVEFPEAGHASYAEFPDLFNEEVKEFAKDVWGLNRAHLKPQPDDQ
jgi:pimeloyl-ACP methyl ester carboxylesterase